MNLKQYNAMPDGELKLAARLAVTMGWHSDGVEVDANILWVREDWFTEFGMCIPFNPFADASIPYGLIGRGVRAVGAAAQYLGCDFFAWTQGAESTYHTSKTHAIIHAYCAADPMGHWAKFMETT